MQSANLNTVNFALERLKLGILIIEDIIFSFKYLVYCRRAIKGTI